MNYYEKNMKCLEAYHKDIFTKLVDYKETIELVVEEQTALDGTQFLAVLKEGRTYRLNSLYSPAHEASRWADQFNFYNLNIIISMFGLGSGYFVRELLSRRNDLTILIYEPSIEILYYALKHFDLLDILSNSNAMLYINLPSFDSKLGDMLHWSNVKSQIICTHPEYERIFLEEDKDFLAVISKCSTRTVINRNTEAYFGRDIVENTLKNMKVVRNANTIVNLKGSIPKGIPAIIVSAGPSLDKNIDELKRAKGRAFILATDTAVKILFDHGIVPDAFVTIDALKPKSYLDDKRFMEIPCFCKIESNYRILQHHRERKILLCSHEYLKQLFSTKFGKQISQYSTGGSVATGAFSVCAELGFETIILIGQDLSYEGDRTHASGSGIDGKILAEEDGIRYVEGIDGGKVKTRHDWYMFLQWFEASIKELNGKHMVIDATEGGAKIEGTKIMKLSEVIDQYCTREVDCNVCIHNQPLALTSEEIDMVYQTMIDTISDMECDRKLAEEGYKLCEKIIASLEKNLEINSQTEKYINKLVTINQMIANSISYYLIDAYISDLATEALDDLYVFTKNETEDRIKTFKKSKFFYFGVRNAAISIRPLLKEACENFYLEEDKEHKKRVVAVMQAEIPLDSKAPTITRKLSGKTILEHVINRVKQSKLIDDIMISTTVYEKDDVIEKEAMRLGVKVFRGGTQNILTSYYNAAKEANADVVVRISSECPLIDSHRIDQAIKIYKELNYDMISNLENDQWRKIYLKGMEIEVFATEALMEAYKAANQAYQRQFVTAFFYEKKKVYSIDNPALQYNLNNNAEGNWEIIEKTYQRLYQENHDFRLEDVIKMIISNKE